MTRRRQIEKLVEQLEAVKARPNVWMDDEGPAIANFIYGVIAACRSLDISFYKQYERILGHASSIRGWQPPPVSLWQQMADADLSEEETQKEVLAVYIEAFKEISRTIPDE